MIYDFDEILGRGIIAARTGRTEEAVKYLKLAAKMEPYNPRIWLWLSAVDTQAAQQQADLNEALRLDPNNLVAKSLLGRLALDQQPVEQSEADFEIFTCPFCGGKQQFDPDLAALRCKYCRKIERLDLSNAGDDERDIHSALQKDSGNWAVLESEAACEACGARTSIPPNQAATRCLFCDSDMVTIHPATPGLITPNAIAPFQFHADDVFEILARQMKVRPEQLNLLLNARSLIISSIYLPFWTFDGRVQIRCNLNYRIEPTEYSNEERVIAKGDWPMAKSWYECDLDDLSVYAAHSLPETIISKLFPFDLKSIYEYRPEILAGWQAEFYQVALKDAEVAAYKRMRDTAFQQAAHRGLFMEPSKMLQDDVLILDETYKLVLLPVFIIKRRVSGKIQKIYVNGQTGKVAEKQTSWWKRVLG